MTGVLIFLLSVQTRHNRTKVVLAGTGQIGSLHITPNTSAFLDYSPITQPFAIKKTYLCQNKKNTSSTSSKNSGKPVQTRAGTELCSVLHLPGHACALLIQGGVTRSG